MREEIWAVRDKVCFLIHKNGTFVVIRLDGLDPFLFPLWCIMNKLLRGLAFGFLYLTTHTLLAADPSGRVAMVVGIDAYPDAPLNNSVSNAKAVREMLTGQLGFAASDVKYCENPDRVTLLECFEKFKDDASNAEIVLFYYAGHAMENINGNYLIPVDAPVKQVAQSEAVLKTHGVNVIGLNNELAESSPGAKIWLLDCSRERPTARAIAGPAHGGVGLAKYYFWRRSGTATRIEGAARAGGGLAEDKEEHTPANTIFMFACAPGGSASNGFESGLFTEALLQILPGNEGPLTDVFTLVSKRVQSITNGQQVPWVNIGYGAVLFESSFLATGSADATANAIGKSGKEPGGE
jgi:uncharacterized protein